VKLRLTRHQAPFPKTLRVAGVIVALAMASCSAPDYTPVREWAATASIAVDLGREACPPDANAAGLEAMQAALATYLSAIGILADDGVLPHRDDPFRETAPRAAALSAQGGAAVASLGTVLQHATRTNAQAPQLRATITRSDPMVQGLVAALGAVVREPGPDEAPASETEARARYARIIDRVGEGHTLLRTHSDNITVNEVVQRIRVAERQLRLAIATLPRPAPALSQGRCTGPGAA